MQRESQTQSELQVLTLVERHGANHPCEPVLTVALTAEERQRSRYRLDLDEPRLALLFRLPRGTAIAGGDRLQATNGDWVQITALPEPVVTVRSPDPTHLLKIAYHLGNRHVALEVGQDDQGHYLRFSPDPVLVRLVEQLGAIVTPEVQPFQPESGAYHHDH
jgi:urease accessory protein